MSDVETQLTFKDLGLIEPVQQALEQSGYVTPTPIQAEAIPHLLEGRDVLGQAQTGTGKTAAFALPLLCRMDLSRARPQVLVLAPTRELALQVSESFERYAAEIPGFRVASIYGGSSYTTQLDALRRGVHVVVGTPGRVMDLMRRGTLRLDNLSCLVLDEADEMLRMGFIEDVQWILSQTPDERQIALFSATMPDPIRQIADQYLRDPVVVKIASKQQTADTIRQRYLVTRREQKLEMLARVLESEPTDGVLVFVKTKMTTAEVAEALSERGFKAAPLSGDVAQSMRLRTVEQLKNGTLDVVIATDVAARGLDVQRISHVINFDLPHDTEVYVHRIGRTGRAGRSGEAILFVTPREQGLLRGIERTTRQTIAPMDAPSTQSINAQRRARFKESITRNLSGPQVESLALLIEEYHEETQIPMPQIAAALAAAMQGDRPLLLDEMPTHFDRNARRQGREGDRDYADARPRRDSRDGEARRPRRSFDPAREGMERYRVEVGKAHGARPGNLVGAIANEAGISSDYIGGIRMFDEFSIVDLPADMPNDLIQLLRKVWVSGRQLRIAPDRGSGPREFKGGFRDGKKKSGFDKKGPRKKKQLAGT